VVPRPIVISQTRGGRQAGRRANSLSAVSLGSHQAVPVRCSPIGEIAGLGGPCAGHGVSPQPARPFRVHDQSRRRIGVCRVVGSIRTAVVHGITTMKSVSCPVSLLMP
jgi:hypothetical protein